MPTGLCSSYKDLLCVFASNTITTNKVHISLICHYGEVIFTLPFCSLSFSSILPSLLSPAVNVALQRFVVLSCQSLITTKWFDQI